MDHDGPQRGSTPDVPDDLTGVDAAQVRAWRDALRTAERRLSYQRRVLQGHLDLALAEAARRRGDHDAPLVARVADALTGPHAAGSARAVGLYAPVPAGDDVDAATSELPDLDAAALTALVARLRARERTLSDERASLLRDLDRLQDELVARYRDRRMTIDDAAAMLGHR